MATENLKDAFEKIDREIAKLPDCQGVQLPATGTWPATMHLFDVQSLWAVKGSLAAGRPLLVRGSPGTGKSQLARAAAHLLNRAFISEVVNSRTECQDLLYAFDAVGRLGEAQALGAAGKAVVDVRERLDAARFVSPGVLWWALDWDSADMQYAVASEKRLRPFAPEGWEAQNGCVVLIDEIDKAEVELPNGLLEILGNGSFPVPYLKTGMGIVRAKEGMVHPLVIITTNEERELPPAFLRRCLVLNISLPREEETFIAFLMKRGDVHFGDKCAPEVREKAARLIWKDRQAAQTERAFIPGQAEYLDLLRAVCEIADGTKKQEEVLDTISGFVLKKERQEEC